MATINPYLYFNGETEEAFNFYKSVFGGEFITLQRYKDMPDAGNLPAADKEKIMHVSFPIGEHTILMANDVVESMGQPVEIGSNFCIAIGADSVEETDRIFKGLSAGGNVQMPLQKTFWGAYFGMFKDKFGINWMINHDEEQS